MVSFAARTLDKPEQRQSPWRIILQGAAMLYIGWMFYRTFRDMNQNWMSLIVAVAILIGVIMQIRNFWKAARPSPWSTIEVRPESVTLFGRDGSFHQLPLPQGYRLLPGDRVLLLRWGRSVPRRCRAVTFRKKHDLTEADFNELYRTLQEIAPAAKVAMPFAPDRESDKESDEQRE